MDTVVYQQTSTLMTIFQHSLNNWKRYPWRCISTISWWEWNWTKPNGMDVRKYDSQQSRWCYLSRVGVLYVVKYVTVWRWSIMYFLLTINFWSGKSCRSGVVKLLEKLKKNIYKNQMRQVKRLSGLFRNIAFVEWYYCNIDIVDDDYVEFDINFVCEE